MQKRSDEIRDKYIANPPEGMTADDIRHMSEDDLLVMPASVRVIFIPRGLQRRTFL